MYWNLGLSPLDAKLRASDGTDRLRVERVLGIARVLLVVPSLIGISLDPAPAGAAWLPPSLLLAYAVLSVSLLVALGAWHDVSRRFAMVVHASDVAWPAVIMTATAGPDSPFFALIQFPLLGAAYRWGLAATLETGGLTAALVTLQFIAWQMMGLFVADFPLNRLIVRVTFIFVLAVLAGILSSAEKRRRGESATIARLIRQVRVEHGLKTSLQLVLRALLDLFDASRAELMVRESATGTVARWWLDRDRPDVFGRQIGPAMHGQPPFAADLQTPLYLSEIALEQRPTTTSQRQLLAACGAASLLFTSYDIGAELEARVALVNPQPGMRESDLNFFQRLVQYLGPVLNNVYLYGRFRSRIGGAERARVARELHDSVIQSIVAAEMEIDVLRRTGKLIQPIDGSLQRVQRLLRDQAHLLREVTERLKPLNLDQKNFIEFLSYMVQRFRRDTGIEASLISSTDDLFLNPRVSRELGRIVQEGLANIRRHSGAHAARVRLRVQDGGLTLLIEDDGRGFDFEGRLEGAALDRSWRGPVVMHERAQSIGATLAVESSRGRGSRIELTLPRFY